ncbi:DUF2157 domain-containing protein [Polluticoccus soli]|uniref:DUF2157 domain-containing protein n=1 Tax=Polluticoccus soli TaxID=3034150 RepID=UPI0023E0B41F|nr:DUF2157 domain-containing protein [Flavipsychrobacter sp. JY13-12]
MFQNRETRETTRIVARHSNMSRPTGEALYKKYSLFADGNDWRRFVPIALLSIGAALTLSGIVFFFAYNWQDLPKAAKIAMVQVLMIATACYGIFSSGNKTAKNIALMAASILTGALFAVYGQIYQTGADAYDFFLGWAVAIAIWVLVSGFPPLWALELILLNLVTVLYAEQSNIEWDTSTLSLILFILNAVPLLILETLRYFKKLPEHSSWMLKATAVAAVIAITTTAIHIIFSRENESATTATWLFIVVLFPLAMWHSFRQRELFYLALIPFGIIIIITASFLKGIDDGGPATLFLAGVFVIGSITALTYNLIRLNRKWHGAEQNN